MVPFYSRILPQYPRTLSGVTVNHKHILPLYKTECRLTLVIIQDSPETNSRHCSFADIKVN